MVSQQQPHSELNLSWVLSSLLVMNTLEFAQLTPLPELPHQSSYITQPHSLQPRADWIRVDI